jgi:predicted lipid-binding transport protein (Tim44 family)
VSLSDLVTLLVGAVQGVGGIALFLLIAMIGFCLLLDMTKFRPTRNSRTVKSLDELTGAPIQYLPPNVPRGPSDQLGGSRRAA